MVKNHSGRLHQRIHSGGANKAESEALELFAHGLRLFTGRLPFETRSRGNAPFWCE